MRKFVSICLLALLLALATTPVLADDPDGDIVIWGDNYTLRSGQTIAGDLLVYGGNVVLEDDSRVERDVTLFGGELDAAGRIDGDVTVWGGNATIRASATIRGQVMSIGGKIVREEGADIRGEEWEMKEGLSEKGRSNLNDALSYLLPILKSDCPEKVVEATTQ